MRGWGEETGAVALLRLILFIMAAYVCNNREIKARHTGAYSFLGNQISIMGMYLSR